MAIGPRSPVVELDAMTHQHLRQPVTRSHQIQAQRLPGANEIAQRLFLGARDADRVKRAGEQQPDEMLSVAAIVLDLVAGPHGIFDGAATTHSIPRFASSRASVYPVGP